jgi:hypothetical protein
MLLWAAAGAALLLSCPALAADCEFNPGKAFSVEGTVLYVDAASDVVAEMGYGKVVAINDRKRGCTAYVQTNRASKCAKGKTATAKGTTFVIPFTPVVLPGADSVKCR